MTSREAFIRVPNGTTITIHDPSSAHPTIKTELPEDAVVIGCSSERCDACSHHRKKVLERGGQFISVRSSGAIEMFSFGNRLKVTRPRKAGFDAGTRQLDSDNHKKDLCETCRNINFTTLLLEKEAEVALFSTYDELIKSSELCPLCSLIASTLVDNFSFHTDSSRPVSLRGKGTGNTIEVSFPSKEEGYDELISERCATLQIYTKIDSNDIPPGITGRLPQNPNDVRVAQAWLSQCQESHTKCRRVDGSQSQRDRPLRLVNVGTRDEPEILRLEEGQNCSGDYLTLSYRWGDPSSITQTTKETISQYKDGIPLDSLSRIFRDAIEFTRLIGVKYIWIDSLCIIQDDLEEKAREVQRMAQIFEGSLATLSASVATSGDSALLTERQRFNIIEVTKFKSDARNWEQQLYVTDQILSDFSDDVLNGILGSRAWCFQERLLAPRLLHFGRDQLHWECHEGIWSESNTMRQWYDQLSSFDDGELRMSLQDNTVLNQPAGKVTFGPTEDGGIERLDAEWHKAITAPNQVSPPPSSDKKRNTYDAWYRAVSAYTYRQLTSPYDKLPALAGAATRFNRFIKDSYAAGIWSNDLPQGLLWSRSAFEAVEVDPETARRPGVGGWGEMSGNAAQYWRGAPSWSWASVDGPVHWVRNRHGPVHIGPYALLIKPSGEEAYNGLEWGAIRVRGPLLEAQQLSWIREEAKNPETQSDFEKWLAAGPISSQPQLDPDDPAWESKLEGAGMSGPLYFLLVCSIPRIPTREDEENGEVVRNLLGYSLMLRYWPGEAAFRRVGIAKVALRDFLTATPNDIHIL